MRSALCLLLVLMSMVVCQAQANCDSLYQRARPFQNGMLVMWFDIPPQIVAGRERLVAYNTPKERAGEAIFMVLIDEQGHPTCLQWLKVSSAAVLAQATNAVSALRFSPGSRNGKPLKVPMTLVARFQEGPPPTKKELRRAQRNSH